MCSSFCSLQNCWWPAALLCVGIFRSLVIFLKQEEEKAQLSKERRGGHSCWEKQDMDKNWLEPTWPKMVEDSTSSRLWASLYAHYNTLTYAKGHTHQPHDSSEADRRRPEVGSGPIPGKPLPSSKIEFVYKVAMFLVSMKLLLSFSGSVVSDSLRPHGLQVSLSFSIS